ncbi:esterase-like activity of phytase family protein [Oculatella sp. LEGE 06141]|uniref:esterase-like activity of phytase family protein n=1 Tax=Oculatella sp. LEGE 06141 TaxID=1828648 RepID=UPI00187F023F|nr:esterase-like activity of phytase family protein [Oculatella sp. LEGE 06141]MBE9181791.1 esterase-like activity of phytase family protein [Oculatella sp. LEGE 06141]
MLLNRTGTKPLWQKGGTGLAIAILMGLMLVLNGCSLPQVSAEERIFLNLSLEFLDEYQVAPTATVADTPVRGLSALTYDRQNDRFYVLSDDRSERSPARFYTMKLVLDSSNPEQVGIADAVFENVTVLSQANGEPYTAGTIDPEGIALSPRQSVFISSEGIPSQNWPPFVNEYDLETGRLQNSLPIPTRYLPNEVDEQPVGVQENLGFEALTLNPGGFSPNWLEPFRLFTATESSLHQDRTIAPPDDESASARIRLLHYLVGEDVPTLISEHAYLLDPDPDGAIANGLTELVVLDQGGHFLSLERAFGWTGIRARIYQIATGGATDTSSIPSLGGDISGITPIRKRLLLDLADLDLPLDNLEGMTLGPQLPDGSYSLILVSDDNFNDAQFTQLLLFRLRGLPG